MKINLVKNQKIEEVLQNVNGKRKRSVSIEELIAASKKANDFLSSNKIPKKTQKGTKVSNDCFLPNSYKNRAEFVCFTIEKGSGDNWFLVDLHINYASKSSYGIGKELNIRLVKEAQIHLKNRLFSEAIDNF